MIIDTYKYPISIYSIFLTSSVLIGFIVATVILIRHKANKTAVICSIMLNGALLIYFGIMFTYIVNIGKGKTSPGVTSMGGVVGIIAGSYIMYRIFKDTMLIQAYLTVFPLIYSISKIGCFFGGCCGGREYYGPLAVNYIHNGKLVNPTLTFPVPLLEAAVFMIIFIIVAITFTKMSFRKHLCLNAFICCAAKFGMDFLRSSHINEIISINQVLCLIIALLAVAVIIWGDKIFTVKKQNICHK